MKKFGLIIGIVCLVLTGCTKTQNNQKTSSQNKIQDKSTQKNKGELASDFALQDLDGNIYKLSDQKGKKVYIKFWASWCPICLSSLASLDEQSKNQKDYQIVTVVSPGHLGEQKKEDFIKWFKSLNYKNIKVLLDDKGEFIKNYGVRATPTNVLIGSDGVLIKTFAGQLNKEALNKIYTEIK